MAATMRTSTLMGSVGADAADGSPSWRTRRSLAWRLRADVADLVEEERAAVRPPRRGRAGRAWAPVKAPRSWPKSSDSENALGDGAAVHGHEGAGCARRRGVDGAGHELLARAALALDEHGGVGGGDPGRRLVDLQHGLAASHDVVEPVAVAQPSAERPVLHGELPVL